MLAARPHAGQRDLSTLPFHPILAAAYPVIYLFAANAAEQVTLRPLWGPLLAAIGGAVAALVLLRLLLGDWRIAGLLTTVLVVGFFGYGHAWNLLAGALPNQWPFLAVWLVAVAVAMVLALRARRVAAEATRALNLVAILALLLNAGGLIGSVGALASSDPLPADAAPGLELAPPDDAGLPDVYYVILDRYAGSTALRETYDFDNEPFLTALEDRGFHVARHAHSNYIKTPFSLASSLNIDLLDVEALEAEATDGKDREPAHRLLRRHLLVPAALKELGYAYLHIGNWWTPSADNVDADRTFVYDGQDEFTTVLAQTTLLRAITEPEAAPDDPWDWRVLREHTLYAIDTLAETADVEGPKFVFAHLLIPHDPYVFDADGSFMDRTQVARQGQPESYRRHLSYANARMLEIVDRILERSPDAVIMLQGDEGPFPARYRQDEWGFDWREATDAELEEKFGILYAMRVPGADLDAHGFHDALTPVNAFRIIFNARFGTDLELLPDRTWAHRDLYHFYDFFEITDRLAR
ncbi:MAG TPA: sulfatase-like hydrolase/transferase [Candidatus Limnocylindria bacterium]|nr:sulfatase-like hydrolase/transferase [Candidatus Limnocylindria bacterium]